VLGDGQRRGVDLGFDYADVRQLVAEHADSLEEVTEPVFVEGGLWDDNIMIGDGGIVSVLGHERAMYGDPLMEFGFAATTVAGMPDPTGFLLGYGRTPTTPAEVTRRRLYSLHMLLVMVIETVYRGHAEPGQYDWARARLAELVASFADRA
jgi:aminoglycoside phosphotransferase (APT) family kinase protein